MKRKLATVLTALLFMLAVAAPASAMITTVTQGDFAFVLAQILGFDPRGIQEAVTLLLKVDVRPLAGWLTTEPMTNGIAREVDKSLERAVDNDLLTVDAARGAVAAALAAIGLSYEVPTGIALTTRRLPIQAPIGGLMGRERRDQGEASPFRLE